MLKSLLWKFLNLLQKSEPDFKPSSTQDISYSELMAIIRRRFPDEGEIYLSDRTYKLCNIDDVREFCQRDNTNHQKYTANDFDCDDFAYRLMGQFSTPDWSALAFGICWTDRHALTCFVDEDKMLWFLEPQSDAIESNLASWQGTRLRFIVM